VTFNLARRCARLASRVGLAGALLAAAACSDGRPMGTVSGTVSVDGKPAEKGAITFIPTDGQAPTAGGEIKAGRYTARVPLGKAKVEVRVPKVVGRKKIYDTPDSPVQDVLDEVLPKKYNDETTLLLEVKAGRNRKDWELKSK
jgi:hypothetical protein